MSRSAPATTWLFTLSLAWLASAGGCVALNIPSERTADPADGGGVFGDWRHLRAQPSATTPHPLFSAAERDRFLPSHAVGHCDDPGHCDGHCGAPIAAPLDGGPLGIDPFDTTVELDGAPKTPEVPWPRFHPLPTRPVFGGGQAAR